MKKRKLASMLMALVMALGLCSPYAVRASEPAADTGQVTGENLARVVTRLNENGTVSVAFQINPGGRVLSGKQSIAIAYNAAVFSLTDQHGSELNSGTDGWLPHYNTAQVPENWISVMYSAKIGDMGYILLEPELMAGAVNTAAPNPGDDGFITIMTALLRPLTSVSLTELITIRLMDFTETLKEAGLNAYSRVLINSDQGAFYYGLVMGDGGGFVRMIAAPVFIRAGVVETITSGIYTISTSDDYPGRKIIRGINPGTDVSTLVASINADPENIKVFNSHGAEAAGETHVDSGSVVRLFSGLGHPVDEAIALFDTIEVNAGDVINAPPQAVTGVTISPDFAIVPQGGIQRFFADVIVTGDVSREVNWSVAGASGGTVIGADGLLTVAPDEAAGNIAVAATSVFDTSIEDFINVTITEASSVTGVTISPETANVRQGGTQQFTAVAAASGGASQEVNWSIIGGSAGTSISADGLLTVAPDKAAGNITVIATSVFDDTFEDFAIVTVTETPSVTGVTISPETASVQQGGAQRFTAVTAASGGASQEIVWSATRAYISADGLLTVAADEAAGNIIVTATSKFDNLVFDSVNVIITEMPRVTDISISPEAASIRQGGDQQFTAVVTASGGAPADVEWTIAGGSAGTVISADGLLTVAADEAVGNITVVAASMFDTSVKDNANVTVTETPRVTEITVTAPAGTVESGTALQFTPDVQVAADAPGTVTWDVDGGAAGTEISEAGLLTVSRLEAADTELTVTATSTYMNPDGVFISGNFTVIVTVVPPQPVLASSISVTGAGNTADITTQGGTLQMSAEVLPANAANKAVAWSVIPGTGTASISSAGLLTAANNGTVTVRATAQDGSNVFGERVITISNNPPPPVLAQSINVTGAGNWTTITAQSGTLQMSAEVLPANAANKAVTWSVIPGTGTASISSAGLLTAASNGTVTARATAQDGSNVFGERVITINVIATPTPAPTPAPTPTPPPTPAPAATPIPVQMITVSGSGGAAAITTKGGMLQMSASVLPNNAAEKSVQWSVIAGSGTASINTAGLLSAASNGTVTVRATAQDGSNVFGERVIVISGQDLVVEPPVITSLEISPETVSVERGGTYVFAAIVSGTGAFSRDVSWRVTGGGRGTSISAAGILTVSQNERASRLRVTAEAGGFSATATVIVTDPPAQPAPTTSPKPAATVTFHGNGGTPTVSSLEIETGTSIGQQMPWAYRTGHTFLGWYTYDGVQLTTGFFINGNITVHARWLNNSTGITEPDPAPSPSPTPSPAPTPAVPVRHDITVGDMRLRVDVSETHANIPMTDAILDAIVSGAGSVVSFDLTEIEGVTSVTFPAIAMRELNEAGANLRVALPGGSVTFGENAMIYLLERAAGSRLTVTIQRIQATNETYSQHLTLSQWQQIGNNPVFSLSVSDGRINITNFSAPVEVRLPHTLSPGENANQLVVYFVDRHGNVKPMLDGHFELRESEYVFTTTHFSSFAILKNPVTFTDIAGHWAHDSILRSGARRLVVGYPDGSYRPDNSVTRAEFVQMLYNALGLFFSAHSGQYIYGDVHTLDWHYMAIGAAKNAGLLTGLEFSDGTFRPNNPITRQEMAMILANLADVRNAGSVNNFRVSSFTDARDIGARYTRSVERAINVGFLNQAGMGDGRFAPNSFVTRAQAASIQNTVLQMLGRISR
ncbi:MAG: Ig-like domain-containing protein [Defluviitaleaceae bacterium]|nr:Ig-like domain-containing protein [Defluviitaleaceae bacterium]